MRDHSFSESSTLPTSARPFTSMARSSTRLRTESRSKPGQSPSPAARESSGRDTSLTSAPGILFESAAGYAHGDVFDLGVALQFVGRVGGWHDERMGEHLDFARRDEFGLAAQQVNGVITAVEKEPLTLTDIVHLLAGLGIAIDGAPARGDRVSASSAS